MEDLFKKAVHLGLGLAATASEKIQEEAEKLVEKGKITREEAEKLFEQYQEELGGHKESLENKFYDGLLHLSKKLNFSENEELQNVKAKLAELEAKLKAMMEDKEES